MPRLEAYFHYRNLDVSTVKILAQRWAPKVAEGFKKEARHQAMDDIKESIAELRHYRRQMFR
jgi:oligoribonuclease